jgi:hypothetical protein
MRMALRADGEHLLALGLPRFLREPRHISSFDDVEPWGRIALRIEHAQGF